ncbi:MULTISPECIES: hypothetical protein [Rhodomicrobium]|nr:MULTISPECIES: hypothetical protein [Rhodomicrobium]
MPGTTPKRVHVAQEFIVELTRETLSEQAARDALTACTTGII